MRTPAAVGKKASKFFPGGIARRHRATRILLGMSDKKPYADACERNRGPILEVLQSHFADRRRVLEIGTGTGQHAVHFARALEQLIWQTSDLEANLPGIRL